MKLDAIPERLSGHLSSASNIHVFYKNQLYKKHH